MITILQSLCSFSFEPGAFVDTICQWMLLQIRSWCLQYIKYGMLVNDLWCTVSISNYPQETHAKQYCVLIPHSLHRDFFFALHLDKTHKASVILQYVLQK